MPDGSRREGATGTPGRRPVLVTGVPRSGTTWLARWLSGGDGMALAGREPMNPRGRQYALAHTLEAWARLTDPSPRQRRALRTAYRGINASVYSRYGNRQWSAALPWTRLVIKDPFALLSLPAITTLTGALPVVLYRHPGAVFTSYQRLGWNPDLAEVQQIVRAARESGGPDLPDLPALGTVSDAAAMAHFWSALHAIALWDIEETGTEVVVVSHAELASSGPSGGQVVTAALGVAWNDTLATELSKESTGVVTAALHNLDRSPAEVAQAWRGRLAATDLAEIEEISGDTLARLEARRTQLS